MTLGIETGMANAILNSMLRGATFTSPAGIWLKLHVGDPGPAGTSNAATITTRQSVTFALPTGGVAAMSNSPAWTTVGNETLTHVSLWDAVSGGAFIHSEAMNAPIAVTGPGSTFTLTAETVTITPLAA